MPSCDLCGKNSGLIHAIIEGSMVAVCKECAKFGKVIPVKKPDTYYENRPMKQLIIKKPEIIEIVSKDCAQKIKQAMDSLKLKPKKLAKMLGVKESLLKSWESSHIKPSIEMARKLEKFFKIKLIEAYEEKETTKEINLCKTTLTIGDLMKKK